MSVESVTAPDAARLYPSRVPSPRARLWTRARLWLVGLIVAASAASALLGSALLAPASVAGMGPLPACRYADILTEPRDYDDWAITLVDTILRVTKDYVPPDLVPVSEAGIGGSGKIRAVAIDDLAAMTVAAKQAGNPIAEHSAYRSYETQESTFQYWVSKDGYAQALLYSARPGHSEHQLGLAIDFKSAGTSSPFSGDWGTTPAGTWMRNHAWEYGWVQSYPKGKKSVTCYAYESWHFRYVGRPLAAKIHASGLTPRQYLWAHFTTAVVPSPSTSPGASPRASSHPSASLKPSPSPAPSEAPSAAPSGSPAPSEAAASEAPPSGSLQPPAPSPSAGTGAAPAAATIDPAAALAIVGLAIGLVALTTVLVFAGRRRSRSEPGL